MKLLLVAMVVGLVVGCALEGPDSSGSLSVDPDSDEEVPDWVTIADVDHNRDGIINIKDLVIVSKFFGQEVEAESSSIERYVTSDLCRIHDIPESRLCWGNQLANIEVGRPFSIAVSPDLSGIGRKEYAADFSDDCEITAKLEAVDSNGQIVENVIIGPVGSVIQSVGIVIDRFSTESVTDSPFFGPSIWTSSRGKHAVISGRFTESALNSVEKLVVKSGSVCPNKTIAPQKVKEIGVNLTSGSDDMKVEAKFIDNKLKVTFSPKPVKMGNLGFYAEVVDKGGIIRGRGGNFSGVYTRQTYVYEKINYVAGTHVPVDMGKTEPGDGTIHYSIYAFKSISEHGDNAPDDLCSTGSRMFITVFNVKENASGMKVVEKGTERLYETDCVVESF